jgi:DNA-binding MarR family transcriptional regulator
MSERLLDKDEWELWHAIKTLSESSLSAVASVIESATGLSGSDFGILSRLEDMGHGVLLQQELQHALGWEKSRLSHQLTRMEARGLLTRASESGVRSVNVKISRQGQTAITTARPVHAAAVRERVLKYVRPNEASALLRLIRRMQTDDG